MTVVRASTARTPVAPRLLQVLRTPSRVLPVTVPLLALALAGLVAHTGGRHIDLEVYRFGVQAWLAGGDLYGSLPETSGHIALPFIYPPFAALLMVPLAVVPWLVAWVALLGLSALSLGVTLYVFTRRLWPSVGRAGALSVASIALPLALAVEPGRAIDFDHPVPGRPAFGLEPVLQTIEFGQINLVLMALVALDCLVPRTKWPRGMLIGIAAAIKLTPAVFVLFFLLRRDYRAAATAAVSGTVATVIGFVVAPAQSWEFWSDPAGGVSGSPFFSNQTFEAMLVRAGVDGTARTATWLLLSAGLFALAAPAIRRAPAPLALVALAAVGLLVSPTSWSHHWVWVAPALLVAAATAWAKRSAVWTAATVAMAAVFVVAPHQFVHPRGGEQELTWTPLQQLVDGTYVWFTVLLIVLLWFARRSWPKPARAPRTG
ncbi:glycosyltransferase family 87 protein [Pseudonocardia cypriaca]|uniref:Alpha-1,2-mannosyltransferase n=1 Tax=Pseudonocardia cypriaca TaxID=882449 RepID=A0A543FTS0_9PSEU|nr:glycosyltransferase family 87 protein [Pseudonocardia cypriaca]TQM37237.1 alpha-1,2-mannosyltransferase [Pseudonocardia cypriaca]